MRTITAQEIALHGRRAARLAAVRLVRIADWHLREDRLAPCEEAEYEQAYDALANGGWEESVLLAASRHLIETRDWGTCENVRQLLAKFEGRYPRSSTDAAAAELEAALCHWSSTTQEGAAFLDRLCEEAIASY
jgi:hypothetical protein